MRQAFSKLEAETYVLPLLANPSLLEILKQEEGMSGSQVYPGWQIGSLNAQK